MVGRARGGVAAEVLAVIPGGASVAVHVGGIRDDGAAEDDDGEVLEHADVLELRARGPSAQLPTPIGRDSMGGIRWASSTLQANPARRRTLAHRCKGRAVCKWTREWRGAGAGQAVAKETAAHHGASLVWEVTPKPLK